MRIEAPGMSKPLAIPLDTSPSTTIAMRVCGDRSQGLVYNQQVNEWFSEFVGVPCSLVRTLLDAPRVCNVQRISSTPSLNSSTGPSPPAAAAAATLSNLSISTTISFANESQFLLVSQASVEELARRMRSTPTERVLESVPEFMRKPQALVGAIDALRFRPNLVVSGSIPPHIEDTWHQISINNITFMV